MTYRLSYADVQSEAPLDAKSRERELLLQSIELMKASSGQRADATVAIEAIHFTSRLWTTFLSDLGGRDNGLANEMRASLISIGIWILKDLDAVRSGAKIGFEDVIEISEIIAEGLL